VRTVRGPLDDAARHLDEAVDQARFARDTLAAALHAREKALAAQADTVARRRWEQIEQALARAVATLERGRTERAEAQAAELAEAYAATELDAIEHQVLGPLRERLETARRDRLDRLVPRTLDAAQATHDNAEAAIRADRHALDKPESMARLGLEQVSHARYLASIVEAVNARQRSLENVLLEMEAPLIEIAHALDVTPDLSHGTTQTARDAQSAIRALHRSLADTELALVERNEAIASLQRALGGATQESLALTAMLEEQRRRRARLERVETMFRHDEAQVLRTGNQLVLRLVGLSFASGSAELQPAHESLLAKALDAITTFPNAVVTIEGHTDAVGAADLNLRLSRQRAEAVRRYLLDRSRLTENQVAAMGFGDERPIATNETPNGRAANRRIDIVLHVD
jgi:OmpA-OmpF porin, OOP family